MLKMNCQNCSNPIQECSCPITEFELKIVFPGGTQELYLGDEQYKITPERSQKLVNHSPDGFAWGYGGSGPAQTALAILLELVPEDVALRNYQQFKWDVIAKVQNQSNVIARAKIIWDRKTDEIRSILISGTPKVTVEFTPSKELSGKCPVCKYPQYSPHDESRPKDIKPYMHVGTSRIRCVNCGFEASADWWIGWDYDCMFAENGN